MKNNYYEQYLRWVKNAEQPEVKSQLRKMQNDAELIQNCFYKNLQFGTGGLRGIMNAGTNCLNYYTVAKTTQGIANYMTERALNKVAVTYDSRNNSQYFAQTVATVFAANGISVFITSECRPTPFLSFAVRCLSCDIGINITASHNPSEYNGYKVYGSDGCQITDGLADCIAKCIRGVDEFSVLTCQWNKAVADGAIKFVNDSVIAGYLNEVFHQSLFCCSTVKVAYSPLNGAGYVLVPKILKMVGVKHLYSVDKQSYPDGDFPTCPSPNPEKDDAMSLVVQTARDFDCDVAIATDPDCDRAGVFVKHSGKYTRLTGNEVGIVLLDFIISIMGKSAVRNKILLKTIVTTSLAEKIANNFGIEVINTLTGFKYIGEKITELEKSDKFLFAFEESCGYLKGNYVRDKDGVLAAMLIAEAVEYHKQKGWTLVDRLNAIYRQYGTYLHQLVSYRFEGESGENRKRQLLLKLRQTGIDMLAGSKVVKTVDFLCQTELSVPKSDVLKFVANGAELVIRPSGTEPLIKAYITVCSDTDAELKIQQINQMLSKMFD